MTSVDNRVVEMRFDNKQFENGVKTSIDSISQLKKSLNLKDSTKNLSDLQNTANKFSLANLSEHVENISSRFTNLGIIGVTALQNITNSAIATGKQLLESLTITPIKMGFQEYETQINAVQTILANTSSKGTTLQQVNAALDELNHYADLTIYNFTEMTRNIGTFTAAGVDLDTSVAAIKGIANLAAVSGSSSQQASTAMYQLSQALAAGTVKLMDWNSVVNAGMGGQVFQDALKETARVHGIAIDEMIESEGSFRETLQHGWLSSEILTETLSKFTGDLTEEQLRQMGYTEEQIAGIIKMGQTANDAATKVKTITQLFDTLGEAMQSGWTQSWEIVLGDFEEAKELLTSVSDVLSEMINASAEARNAILQDWKDLGGRTALIDALKNTFNGLMGVVKPIKEAFSDVFPAPTGQALADLSFKIRDLTAGFSDMSKTSDRIKGTFRGLFTLIQPIVIIIQALGKSLAGVIGSMSSAFDGLLRFTSLIGTSLYDSVGKILSLDTTVVNVKNAFDGLFSILRLGGAVVSTIASAFGTLIETVFGKIDVSGGLVVFLNAISRSGFSMTKTVDGMIEKIDKFSESLNKSIRDNKGITVFIDSVSKAFSSLNMIVSKVIETIKKLFKSGFESVGDIFSNLGNTLSPVLEGIQNVISEFISNIKFGDVIGVLNTGLIGGILYTLKKFFNGLKETNKEGGIFDSVKDVLNSLKEGLETLQNSIKADIIKKIAVAVAILAASLFVLSTIDPGNLASALGAMSVMFVELFGSMAIFEKVAAGKGFDGIVKVIGSMTALSVAVLILSAAVKNLSSLDWQGLAKGLTGVGAILAELAVFMNYTDFSGLKFSSMTGLISLALAINLLGVAVSKFGSMDIESIIKGLTTVGLLLAELTLFTQGTAEASGVVRTAAGLLILGAAVNVLVIAIEKMGDLSLEQIGKGLLAMGGSLLVIAGAVELIPNSILLVAPALLVISAALVVLSKALEQMGNMSIEAIGKSLVTLGGSLVIIAAAMEAMKLALSGAAALIVVAAAIAVLTPALLALGNMSLEQIGSSLLMLAGVFVVLGGAASVLQPLVPTIVALSAAIALLGVGAAAVGAGVLALSVGLTGIATSGVAAAVAITAIFNSIISLLPALFKALGEAVVELAGVITNGAPAIKDALVALITSVLLAIQETFTTLASVAVTMIQTFCTALLTAAPMLIDTAIQLILMFLQGIADNIYQITVLAGDIIVNFINGIAEKLPEIVEAGFNLITTFITSLADTIENNIPMMVDSFTRLFWAMVDAAIAFLSSMVGSFLSRGEDLINGLKDGVNNIKDRVIDAVKSIPEKAISGIRGKIGDFRSIGENLIDGLKEGIQNAADRVVSAAKGVVDNAVSAAKNLLGIASPSKVFTKIGEYCDEGMVNGLLGYKGSVEKASEKVSDSAVKGMSDFITNLMDISTKDFEYEPVIRPVLDMSNVDSDLNRLKSQTISTSRVATKTISGYTGFNKETAVPNSYEINVTFDIEDLKDIVNNMDTIDTFINRLQRIKAMYPTRRW